MSRDEAFIQDIVAHPKDDALRLIYADWLDEQGDPRAAFLRLDVEMAALPDTDKRKERLRKRLQRVRKSIDPAWLARLDRTAIENCEPRFAFECPRRWESLQLTGDDKVRFCNACRKPVFHCDTLQEAQGHAWDGECVAIDSRFPRTPGDLRTGEEVISVRMGRWLPPGRTRRSERRGQTVTILTGALAGMQGEVERRQEDRQRIRVRVQLSGRPVSLDLNVADVEAVAESEV
jgi:uncharacterized protein (TIGR02996 family)